MSDNKLENNRQKNNKNLVLTIGVSLLAILIASLWFLNIRKSIFQTKLDNETNRQYWQQLQVELDNDLKDFNLVWNEVKTSEELSQSQELIDQMKEQIENDFVEQLATSTLDNFNESTDNQIGLLNSDQLIDENSSTTTIKSDQVLSCPEFIDCLADDCVIPDGCEDISFIVY